MAGGAASTVAGASAVALSEVVVAFRVARGGSYTAVERATLKVADGEFVAIVGPTGCGKSTLLNIAAGLMAPSAGGVDIFGSPLAARSTARPVICSRPTHCFPGRPRWRMSPSVWRRTAWRQALRGRARKNGSRASA